MFLNLLETLNPEEAELLILAKDKKMKPVFKKKKPPTSTFSSRQYNPLTGSSGGGGYKPSRRQVRKGG